MKPRKQQTGTAMTTTTNKAISSTIQVREVSKLKSATRAVSHHCHSCRGCRSCFSCRSCRGCGR